MPVTLERAAHPRESPDPRERRVRRGAFRDRGKRLRIGLVNNMPDAALEATERQFSEALARASDDFDIELSLWSLDSLDRKFETRRAMAGLYRPARELRGAERDALIVTGAEPRAPDLREEPYWDELAALLDWSRARVTSTLLSCLAAHAAVLRADGIARRRLPAKCSGIFAADVVTAHELTEGFRPGRLTPHSRLNGLDEAELAAKGYLTLTRSGLAGVDMFVKEGASLQVFLQGHPEYDADTLAKEYRRDALRFLRGERPEAPPLPHHYFPETLAARLREFVARASPGEDPAALYPREALAITAAPWRASSALLFRNWLAAVARRKAARHAPGAAVRWGG
jgi:homoserine O-succinyltransferase